jgi:hypothetical protein
VGFVQNPVLGLLETDLLHNIIHLISGTIGLALVTQGNKGVITYGKVMTLIYGLVTIAGFFMNDNGTVLGLLHINTADNILHLALTIIFIYLGFFYHEKR